MINIKKCSTPKEYLDILNNRETTTPDSLQFIKNKYGEDVVDVINWVHLLFIDEMGRPMDYINYTAAKELKSKLNKYIKNREVK